MSDVKGGTSGGDEGAGGKTTGSTIEKLKREWGDGSPAKKGAMGCGGCFGVFILIGMLGALVSPAKPPGEVSNQTVPEKLIALALEARPKAKYQKKKSEYSETVFDEVRVSEDRNQMETGKDGENVRKLAVTINAEERRAIISHVSGAALRQCSIFTAYQKFFGVTGEMQREFKGSAMVIFQWTEADEKLLLDKASSVTKPQPATEQSENLFSLPRISLSSYEQGRASVKKKFGNFSIS